MSLIVSALKDEVSSFLAKMSVDVTLHLKPATLYQGTFEGRPVELLVTGMGREYLEKSLKQALDYKRPKFLLHVGYAGGASPTVGVGTMIVASAVVSVSEKLCCKPEADFLKRGEEICRKNSTSFQVGGLATVDRVISSPYEKADIGVTCNALALDMEAVWFAKIAVEKKIPWLAAKTILDPMEMELPDLSDCLEETGDANSMKALQHLAKSPQDFTTMTQLRTNAAQARETIFKFLEGWVVS